MTIVRVGEGQRIKKATVVCLGLFDGVHRGHQALVSRAGEIAAQKRLKVCVHTFEQMPVRMLRPDEDILELTPLPEKAELLAALGVDMLAISAFDEAMMRMRAEDFFASVLLRALHAEHIVVGFHHRFGFRGKADVQALRALCDSAGIGLDVVPPVTLQSGELISSTAIRGHLRAGAVAAAEAMLGRTLR